MGPTLLNTDVIEASDKLLAFSHRLADRLISETREKSVVFSPLSVASALQLLVLGARGRTHEELTQLLGYQLTAASSEAIHNDYERLIGQLLASNSNLNDPEIDHFVRLSNALFVQQGFSLRPDYKAVVQSVYRGEIFSLDLHASSAVKQVNKWVEESTNGKVREIITRPVDPLTKVLIASSVYFNAKWKTTFFEDMTKKRPFWIEGRDRPSVQVDMMAIGGKFPYADVPEYDCRILGLPYKNSTSTMFIVIPNNSSVQAVKNLHSRLSAQAINQMIRSMEIKTAIGFLPKMQLTSTIDLHRELARSGVTSLFDPVRADLGLIAGDSEEGQFQVPFGQSFGGNFVRPAGVVPLQHKQQQQHEPTHFQQNLEDSLIFTRFNNEEAADDEKTQSRSKRSSYKSESVDGKSVNPLPLRMKDFVLNKRITKENKLNKKSVRHRRQLLSSSLDHLRALDRIRSQGNIRNPGLFANEIVHKVDLTINEKGTEGGAGKYILRD